jgi:hypothetical protein
MFNRNMLVSTQYACVLLLFGMGSGVLAQDAQVTPKMFGLGDNTNKRTAEPSEIRAYPATKDGKTADRSKGPVWIGSKTTPEYKLKENEVAVYHGALDISSRGPDGKPVAREFTAGVYGTVLASRPGFIAVQLADGNIVQYLHVSEARLKPGQAVRPDTILGETGKLGANGKPIKGMAIHLHIQVTNRKGKLVDPDRAILAGRAEKQDRTIKWVKPNWVDVGPLLIASKRPKVGPDGVVKADAANKRLYFDESAPKGANLVGTKWSGKYKRPRVDDSFKWNISFEFQDDKRVIQKYLSHIDKGTWKEDGKSVVVSFPDGTEITFTRTGDTMTGRITKKGDPRDESVEYQLKKQ